MDNRPSLEFEKGYAIIINDFENNLYYYFDYDTRQSFHMRFQHIHTSFYEMLIPLDAGISHIFNGVPYPLEKNDIALIPPGVPHRVIYPEGAPPLKRLVINFMYPKELFNLKEGFEELFSIFQIQPSIIRLTPNHQNACFQLLNSIYNLSKQASSMHSSVYEVLLQAKFTEFLFTLYQAKKENQYVYTKEDSAITQKIYEICSYVHANYSKPLSLDSLAKIFYISPYYLSRQFKQTTGFNLTEYIQNTRIINAQFLLATTENTVSDIATACGFTSFSQFNRVFHQKSNCSPTEYRRSHGQSILV
ncbi:MAG: helix-turn-helix domain-containing protein [bacterium]|nr:helix-turn-helix domain-containing protein [bacterium]